MDNDLQRLLNEILSQNARRICGTVGN